MDKGLANRQKFREDFLKLMKDHDLTSATVQFIIGHDNYGDYDDFIINNNAERVDDLEKLIEVQGASKSHSEDVLKYLKIENRKK